MTKVKKIRKNTDNNIAQQKQYRDPLLGLPQLNYYQSAPNKSEEFSSFDRDDGMPMEYRAQIPGRCQRQFISDDSLSGVPKTPDIATWLQEWIQGSREHPSANNYDLKNNSETKSLEINIYQRLISNCGTDDGLIRPILAAGGWPIIPGSSIKGLFRSHCNAINEPRINSWCGNSHGDKQIKQGNLRFHGAYPMNREWRRENGAYSLDIVHPQWKWQLGFKDSSHSAFAVVSLFKPKLIIPVSTSNPNITPEEWRDIMKILENAITSEGIGGRTSSGYGVSGEIPSQDIIFQCSLTGSGTAAKLLSGKHEYRSTMFRAAIRGMALRIFGGVCDEATAEREVDILFGGISGDRPRRGLLSCRYIDQGNPEIKLSKTDFPFPVYTGSGRLQWSMNSVSRPLGSEEVATITILLEALHGLVMTLGGYGKGWRRIDHQFFGKSLSENGYKKAPIGCHWQWLDHENLPARLKVNSAADIQNLLVTARDCALKRLGPQARRSIADWQEVIHPDRMYIWTREAKDPADSRAMAWLHAKKNTTTSLPHALQLHRSELAGRLIDKRFNDGPTCVSRIWHRLSPLQERQETKRAEDSRAQQTSSSAAFQRPSRGGVSTSRLSQQSSHSFWNGPFLECFVLFPIDQRSEHRNFVKGAEGLIQELNRGAGADFERLYW